MSTEMVVNVSPRETRAALLENGVLQELFVERASRRGLVGQHLQGPGIARAAWHAGCLHRHRARAHRVPACVRHRAPADAEGSSEAVRTDSIRELVGEGDEILVQVVKDPLGTKGARLTTFVTIPSRYLVYMPFGHGVGVSARIETEEERAETARRPCRRRAQKAIAEAISCAPRPKARRGGAARRHAVPAQLWERAHRPGARAGQGTLVHEDLPLPLRMLRDLVGADVDRVLVDSRTDLRAHADVRAQPSCRSSTYASNSTPAARPIFDLHGVEEEIASRARAARSRSSPAATWSSTRPRR